LKVNKVGGVVRDHLLKRTPGDSDYTVTDVTREELLASGWKSVGKSYEVFLHPETGEEYTLADSIEEDLLRRDLTINAMAMDGEVLIDPTGGVYDLQRRILRHVRPQNLFDDPLRVYRIARFGACLPEFQIDHETRLLLRDVSHTAAFRDLQGERIFGELAKALIAPVPRIFFDLLRDIQCEDIHFAPFAAVDLDFLDRVTPLSPEGSVRFAALASRAAPGKLPALIARLHVPGSWAREALLVSHHFTYAGNLSQASAAEVVSFFYDIDAWRRPHNVRLFSLLLAADAKEELAVAIEDWFEITASLTRPSKASVGKEMGVALRIERALLLNKRRVTQG
jgi:tRNA nucleotidyltransferase (CCA-adding enzyme)